MLNTVFLNLLLHLLKMPSAVTKNNMHTQTYRGQTQLTTKALGATALALFLRYATYVEPPKLSKEKDHSSVTILAVLVTLLRDPALPRQDNVLRRRALAALGEIVFYISAQEDDGEENRGGLNSESSRAKWTLPPAAVSALTKALSDDTDEISRHYAAKVLRFLHPFRLQMYDITHTYIYMNDTDHRKCSCARRFFIPAKILQF